MKAIMMPEAMSRPSKRQRSSIGEAYPRYASLLEDITSTTAGSNKSNRVCSRDWVKDLKGEYNPNLDVTRVFLDDGTEFTNKRVRSGGAKQNLRRLNDETNSRPKFNDGPMRVPLSAFSSSLDDDLASTSAGGSKSNRVCSTDWIDDLRGEYNPNLDVSLVYSDDSTDFAKARARSDGVKLNLHHLNDETNSRLEFNDEPMRLPSSAFSSSLDDELRQELKSDQTPTKIRLNQGASHRFSSWDEIESVIEQELSNRKQISENDHRVTTADLIEQTFLGGDDGSTTRVVSEDESSCETDNEADGKERKPQEMSREWNDNDVLFGRGGLSNHHPGNKIYREKVKELKPQYKMSVKVQKTALSQSVVDYIYELGGRFLLHDEKSGRWTEANNTQARRKVAQAFREGEGRRK